MKNPFTNTVQKVGNFLRRIKLRKERDDSSIDMQQQLDDRSKYDDSTVLKKKEELVRLTMLEALSEESDEHVNVVNNGVINDENLVLEEDESGNEKEGKLDYLPTAEVVDEGVEVMGEKSDEVVDNTGKFVDSETHGSSIENTVQIGGKEIYDESFKNEVSDEYVEENQLEFDATSNVDAGSAEILYEEVNEARNNKSEEVEEIQTTVFDDGFPKDEVSDETIEQGMLDIASADVESAEILNKEIDEVLNVLSEETEKTGKDFEDDSPQIKVLGDIIEEELDFTILDDVVESATILNEGVDDNSEDTEHNLQRDFSDEYNENVVLEEVLKFNAPVEAVDDTTDVVSDMVNDEINDLTEEKSELLEPYFGDSNNEVLDEDETFDSIAPNNVEETVEKSRDEVAKIPNDLSEEECLQGSSCYHSEESMPFSNVRHLVTLAKESLQGYVSADKLFLGERQKLDVDKYSSEQSILICISFIFIVAFFIIKRKRFTKVARVSDLRKTSKI